MDDQDLGRNKRRVGRPAYGTTLSPVEARVFESMLVGLSNDEISQKLGLRVKTIKFHVRSILRKKCMPTRFKLLASELQNAITKRSIIAMSEIVEIPKEPLAPGGWRYVGPDYK